MPSQTMNKNSFARPIPRNYSLQGLADLAVPVQNLEVGKVGLNEREEAQSMRYITPKSSSQELLPESLNK